MVGLYFGKWFFTKKTSSSAVQCYKSHTNMMLHPVAGCETWVKTVPFWGLVEAHAFPGNISSQVGSLTFGLSSARPQPLKTHTEKLSPPSRMIQLPPFKVTFSKMLPRSFSEKINIYLKLCVLLDLKKWSCVLELRSQIINAKYKGSSGKEEGKIFLW